MTHRTPLRFALVCLLSLVACDTNTIDEPPSLLATAREHVREPGPRLHPCGNAIVDDGETCDDGLANGDDRECTMACEINECELDEAGWCVELGPLQLAPCDWTPDGAVCPHPIAADVELAPCDYTIDGDLVCDGIEDLAQ